MDEIFFRLVNSGFLELSGLRVDASIPVPEHIVNEMIEVTLRGNKSISYCRVVISKENRVLVRLKTPVWPWPLNMKLKLESSMDFSSSPKIRAVLENNVALGKLGAFFKALPDWMTIQDNQVVVDVQSFLDTPEQKRNLSLIKSVGISTKEAKLIFDVKVAVDKWDGQIR